MASDNLIAPTVLQLLPAHILIVGSVTAVEPEIRCFTLNLRQAFLENTTTAFISVSVFITRDDNPPRIMPPRHSIVAIKGHLLDIDENRVTVILDNVLLLQ